MDEIDARIIVLVEFLKVQGVIRFNSDFCRDIDISKQHFWLIKNGTANFTTEHIYRMQKKYKLDVNWIFGIGEEMFLKDALKFHNKEKKTIS